ncbi:hypothetical protein ACH49_30535, partial [Streptomyces leeuwenhoekii]
VALGAPDENGSRTVDVYSLGDHDSWTRHATGLLSAAPTPRRAGYDFTTWPPPRAERVEVEGFYESLVGNGYAYGPVFQGLRSVWRRGDEVFAEVALPEEQRKEADRYGIHPALLDAALHAGMLGAAAPTDGQEPDAPVLPFAWNGLVLHAAGASALRVRLTTSGPGAVALEAADETGDLVVAVDSLVSRPVSVQRPGLKDALFLVEWSELAAVAGEPSPSWHPVTSADELPSGIAVLEASGGQESPLSLT